ncbi:hypothetical protein U27_05190 [Candidatus Vecturithrix granuli]|uniref:Uncharacterized protein n=1 Tax=Vecturithrix granuli TaxID=1499967 RepID=A0A081C0W2_VECG1|nr:hypothetical protein U27_05190 [Candidatus Vecturithrix granuli]
MFCVNVIIDKKNLSRFLIGKYTLFDNYLDWIPYKIRKKYVSD